MKHMFDIGCVLKRIKSNKSYSYYIGFEQVGRENIGQISFDKIFRKIQREFPTVTSNYIDNEYKEY